MTHRHTCSEGVSHVFDGLLLLLITTGPAVFELVGRMCVMLNNFQTACDSSEGTRNTCSQQQSTALQDHVLQVEGDGGARVELACELKLLLWAPMSPYQCR